MAQQYAVQSPQIRVPVGPTGFGGWLILIAIIQVLSPISNVSDVAVRLSRVSSYDTVTDALIIDVVFALFVAITSIMFFARKRIFKTMFTIEEACFLAFNVSLAIPEIRARQDVSDFHAAQIITGIVLCVVLVAYVWRSKRVENTFVN